MTLDNEGAILQAGRFNATERRQSLAGVPELFRTHSFAIPTATIPAAAFPARTAPVTFKTALRITNGATAAGLLFEFGDAANGAVAAWLESTGVLHFRAGGVGTDFAHAIWNNGGAFTIGRKMELMFLVIPGSRLAAIFLGGKERARNVCVSPMAEWARNSNGSFAAAANGVLPADVLQTGAPVGFELIQPLSVYNKQVVRGFRA